MTLLIQKCRLMDPASGRDEILDILIEGTSIVKIGRSIPAMGDGCEIIDASGLVAAPGLIDLHAHLREPGYEYKETIRTGTMAAVRGGFTSVVCMANTNPVNDSISVTDYIVKKGKSEGLAHVFPCGAITKGLEGKELSEVGEMFGAGIVALSDDGRSVKNAGLLRKAFEYAKLFDLPLISHCEDADLADGVVHEGRASLISGLDAIPSIAEEIVARRDIAVAKYVDGPVHITHISTAGTVEIVRDEKKRFQKVTCDTCPHYFTLSDEATLTFDTNTKVNPPLRSQEDVAAIKEGLRDGTIDVIATDHAPHDAPSKDVEYTSASFGISGFETAFSLSLALVHQGVLPLMELLRKLTVNPASILKLPLGELKEGGAADLILFHPEMECTVDKYAFRSKGKNTPFHGFSLKGKNLLTVVDGAVVYRDENYF